MDPGRRIPGLRWVVSAETCVRRLADYFDKLVEYLPQIHSGR
jgi:hypothetical protein